jgi:hypothetical protein
MTTTSARRHVRLGARNTHAQRAWSKTNHSRARIGQGLFYIYWQSCTFPEALIVNLAEDERSTD